MKAIIIENSTFFVSIICLLIMLFILSACATPETILKNGTDVKTCGGGYMGSVVGGLPGYYIQTQNDQDCVAQLKAQGYRVQ